MKRRLFYGRTAPTFAEARLQDRVETLHVRRRRVELFFRPTWLPNAPLDTTFLSTYETSLPPIHLPDGSLPYVEGSNGWYGGSTQISVDEDPRLEPLWLTCAESKPARGYLHVFLRETAMFKHAAIDLFFDHEEGRAEISASVEIDPIGTSSEGIDIFMRAAGLKHYADSGHLVRPTEVRSGGDYRVKVRLSGLPPDPAWPARFLEAVRALGWDRPAVLGDLEFTVLDVAAGYSALRARLNAITRSWTTDRDLIYRKGFDPFVPPSPPPVSEEYRFPLAAYPGDDDDREPTVQVDVVHGRRGSFLEFVSAKGPKTIRKYADLADVEVEIWGGSPEERWDD